MLFATNLNFCISPDARCSAMGMIDSGVDVVDMFQIVATINKIKKKETSKHLMKFLTAINRD